MTLALDQARSRIRIHTFAEGLMARLAHDLELVATALEGTATIDGTSAHLEIALRGLTVEGVLGKDGRVDGAALSVADRRAILEKMHADVFGGAHDGIVRIDVEGGAARVRFPSGRIVETEPRIETRSESRAVGELTLSLDAIGARAVKGPMNAFRVKDRVVVLFDLVFSPS